MRDLTETPEWREASAAFLAAYEAGDWATFWAADRRLRCLSVQSIREEIEASGGIPPGLLA